MAGLIYFNRHCTIVHHPVRDLSNETMLRMMANENMSEWDHDAVIDRETLLAVTKAHKNNELTLVPAHKQLTHQQIADFLSWSKSKVIDALKQIEALSAGVVEPNTFDGMKPRVAGDFADGALGFQQRAKASGQGRKLAVVVGANQEGW